MGEFVDNGDGTVTISREEYDSLIEDSFLLACLEEVGVDNWDGWELAIKLLGVYAGGNEG